MKAMLPTGVDRDQLDRYLDDPAWCIAEKHDGDRVIGHARNVTWQFFNRDGAPYTKAIPTRVREFVDSLPTTFVLDGELVDGVWHLFDVVIAGADLASRLGIVEGVADAAVELGYDDVIQAVPHLTHPIRKRQLVENVIAASGEGFVVKRLESLYQSGRAVDWVKIKLVVDADFVVVGKGEGGKSNLLLSVYRDGALIDPPVAKCSALTGDGPRVQIGDVVTCTLLAMSAGGRAVQCVKPRLRTGEVQPSQCTWAALPHPSKENA